MQQTSLNALNLGRENFPLQNLELLHEQLGHRTLGMDEKIWRLSTKQGARIKSQPRSNSTKKPCSGTGYGVRRKTPATQEPFCCTELEVRS